MGNITLRVHAMTIESAEAEYERLKARTSTEEELWAGWRKLVEGTFKINFALNNICDNDEQENDPYP